MVRDKRSCVCVCVCVCVSSSGKIMDCFHNGVAGDAYPRHFPTHVSSRHAKFTYRGINGVLQLSVMTGEDSAAVVVSRDMS
jgi:hypothetical protein